MLRLLHRPCELAEFGGGGGGGALFTDGRIGLDVRTGPVSVAGIGHQVRVLDHTMQ